MQAGKRVEYIQDNKLAYRSSCWWLLGRPKCFKLNSCRVKLCTRKKCQLWETWDFTSNIIQFLCLQMWYSWRNDIGTHMFSHLQLQLQCSLNNQIRFFHSKFRVWLEETICAFTILKLYSLNVVLGIGNPLSQFG